MDQVDELKRLGRGNRCWHLGRPFAQAIDSLMSSGEVPLLVLPTRDVWVSGVRPKGMKPLAVATDRQFIVITYASRWGRPKYVVISRKDIVDSSFYPKRTFELKTTDGTSIKVRGLIGGKSDDDRLRRLYDILSKE